MTINFILNGEDVVFRGEAGVRLIDILRGDFGLFGAKRGCLSGQCGACTVIFNGYVSPACLIPAFKIKGCEIITIEGFSQTIEYQEIIEGFSEVHLGNCGYCEAGKILCAEALLDRALAASPERTKLPEQTPTLTKEEVLMGFSGIKCRCTNIERLIKAVNLIAASRQGRLNGNFS